MIATVVREHHWSPAVVGDLYCDSEDYQGLEFWYNDVLECIENVKAKTTVTPTTT
ncbi:MAG: hypothetical protein H7282_04980 [Cytophagaceae bacterium]|nr:hypothetical protein [Cytophagaceae bacterium]